MRRTRVPWYLWCSALAVTSAYVGGYWDISWHRSIGRDTFWSAPHMAIYACGILAGISSAYLIVTATFRRSAPPSNARIWGLSGPIGAFISAWGGVAMLASAPFDDWWHNAYGLDVRVISPPHMVLAAGFFGIELGTIMLFVAFLNRTDEAARAPVARLFLYVSGTVLCESLLLRIEYIHRSVMHTSIFYIVVAIGTPLLLSAFAIVSRRRWACTAIAAIYTAFGLGFLWILPLFPAAPKLGPVFRPVTHFIPWEFPLLIVVPAFAADLVLQRTGGWRPLARGAAVGVAFFGAFVAAQWPFAWFLMTPAARNWFFGAGYFDFSTPARSDYASYLFVAEDGGGAPFWIRMLIAAATSCLMAWVGVRAGHALRKVRR